MHLAITPEDNGKHSYIEHNLLVVAILMDLYSTRQVMWPCS